jgi:hypothetical protein
MLKDRSQTSDRAEHARTKGAMSEREQEEREAGADGGARDSLEKGPNPNEVSNRSDAPGAGPGSYGGGRGSDYQQLQGGIDYHGTDVHVSSGSSPRMRPAHYNSDDELDETLPPEPYAPTQGPLGERQQKGGREGKNDLS